MANPKNKALPKLFNMFLFVILAHCIDTFVSGLMGDRTIFANNLYGHAAGIIIIFIACAVKKRDFRYYGLDFRPKKIFKGLCAGLVFSGVPLAFFSVVKLFLSLFGIGTFGFRPPNANAIGNQFGIGKSFLIYAFTSLVTVFMYEYFLRGYILKQARPVYSFSDANIIQSAFFPMFSLVTVARNFLFSVYDRSFIENVITVAISIVFFLVTDFMTGIKRGMLTRVTENIWAAFFDHYIYKVIGFSIFVSRMKIDTVEIFIYLTLIQAFSFVLVYFYYKKEQAKREAKKLQSKMKHYEHYNKKMNEENNPSAATKISDDPNADKLESYTSGSVREKVAEFSDVTKSRRKTNPMVEGVEIPDDLQTHHTHHHRPGERDDDLVSIGDIDVKNFYKEYADEITKRREAEQQEVREKAKNAEAQIQDKKKNKKE